MWRAAIAAAALASTAWVAGAGVGTDARKAVDDARGLLEAGTAPGSETVQSLARNALERDTTVPAAIELIALAKESRGDRHTAASLYRLSDRISRRSLATRLWLAQDSVERGDVRQTLAQFETALRTSSAAPPIVFPALVRGLEDPALVKPIATMVDRPSDWREAFLIYAAESAPPAAAAALFLTLVDRRTIQKDQLDRKLVSRLVEDGQFALARRADRALASRRGTPPLVADGGFDDSAALYPFGWGFTDAVEVGASREVEKGRSVLAYHANSAESGQVAAQLLTLNQGRYVLESRSLTSASSDVPPLWVISCADQSRVLATVAVGTAAAPRSLSMFSVPTGCPAQWLTLAIRPALAPQSGTIESVRISRR